MSKVLLTARPVRVSFNPRDKKHLASFKTFLETGQWGDVKFELEQPHHSVPHMVLTIYAAHKLGVVQQNQLEKVSAPDISMPQPIDEEVGVVRVKLKRVV